MNFDLRHLSFLIVGLLISQGHGKGDFRQSTSPWYDRFVSGSWSPFPRYLFAQNQNGSPFLVAKTVDLSDNYPPVVGGSEVVIGSSLLSDQGAEPLPPSLIQWLETRRLLQLSDELPSSSEYPSKSLEIKSPSFGSEATDGLEEFNSHGIYIDRRQLPQFTHRFIGKRPKVNNDYSNAKGMPIELFSRRVPHYSHSFIGKRSDEPGDASEEDAPERSTFDYPNSFLDKKPSNGQTLNKKQNYRGMSSSSSGPLSEMLKRRGPTFAHKFIGKRSLYNVTKLEINNDKRVPSFDHSFIGKRLSPIDHNFMGKEEEKLEAILQKGELIEGLENPQEQPSVETYHDNTKVSTELSDKAQIAYNSYTSNDEKRQHYSHSFLGKRNPSFSHSFIGKRPRFGHSFVGKRPSFSHSFVGKRRTGFGHSFVGKRLSFGHSFVGKRPSFAHSFVGKRPSFAHSFVGKRPSFAHSFVGKRPSFAHSFVGKRPSFAHSFVGKRVPDFEPISMWEVESVTKDLSTNENKSEAFPGYTVASPDLANSDTNSNDSTMRMDTSYNSNSEDYMDYFPDINEIPEKRQPSYSHKFIGKRLTEFDDNPLEKRGRGFGHSFVGKRKNDRVSGEDLEDYRESRDENKADEPIDEEEELQHAGENDLNDESSSSNNIPKI